MCRRGRSPCTLARLSTRPVCKHNDDLARLRGHVLVGWRSLLRPCDRSHRCSRGPHPHGRTPYNRFSCYELTTGPYRPPDRAHRSRSGSLGILCPCWPRSSVRAVAAVSVHTLTQELIKPEHTGDRLRRPLRPCSAFPSSSRVSPRFCGRPPARQRRVVFGRAGSKSLLPRPPDAPSCPSSGLRRLSRPRVEAAGWATHQATVHRPGPVGPSRSASFCRRGCRTINRNRHSLSRGSIPARRCRHDPIALEIPEALV